MYGAENPPTRQEKRSGRTVGGKGRARQWRCAGDGRLARAHAGGRGGQGGVRRHPRRRGQGGRGRARRRGSLRAPGRHQTRAMGIRGGHRHQRVRRHRRAGEQRRHPQHRHPRGLRALRVASDPRHQSDGRVPRHPRRGETHEGSGTRIDHQHLLDRRDGRHHRLPRLHRNQVRGPRVDEIGGAGTGAERNPSRTRFIPGSSRRQ